MSQCLSGDREVGQKQICLVGFQGAGKTTVGKWLSSIMKIDFFDLDASLLAKHGYSTIQEALAQAGDAHRALESRATTGATLLIP